MGDSQIYKKFFLQKKTLDTMRAFLDLNDSFLDKLTVESIITDEELREIKNLHWPRNRNELLQNLVKKSWTKEQMDAFFKCLQASQNSQIIEIMFKEREVYMKAVGDELLQQSSKKRTKDYQNKEKVPPPKINNDLDKLFKKKLTVTEQNIIRGLLNERDTEIAQLKLENQELRKQIKEAIAENTVINNRVHSLDKATADLLACVEWDVDQQSVEHGLAEIKTKLVHLQSTVHQQNEQIIKHYELEKELKDRLNMLTEDNKTLTELHETAKEDLQKSEQQQSEGISELSSLLDEEREHVIKLQNRLQLMEGRYRSAILTLQEQITNLKKDLDDALKRLKLSDDEKNKVRNELGQLNDKTRKLLVSLDLENECKDAAVAVDFARNISIVKRRNSTVMSNRSSISSGSIPSPMSSASNNSDQLNVTPRQEKVVNGKSSSTQILLARRRSNPSPSFVVRNNENRSSLPNDLGTINEHFGT